MSNVVTIAPFEPRNLSLQQLVLQKTEVIQHIIENDGELSVEDEHLLNIANQLTEKKIDGVCVFVKRIIPAAYQALEEAYAAQKSKIERTEEWMGDLVKQALAIEGASKIDGVMWRVRLQPNPQSVEIVDENLVPEFLKKRQHSISVNLPFGHDAEDKVQKLFDKIEELVKEAGGELAGRDRSIKINRKELTAQFKTLQEDGEKRLSEIEQDEANKALIDSIKASMKIEGVKMPEKTYHVRYEAGKSDIGSVAKKGKKKKEIEVVNAEQ